MLRTSSTSVATPTPRKSAPQSAPLNNLLPSYKWINNSCWLDSSLETLWNLVQQDFGSFAESFSDIPNADRVGIHQLYQMFDRRRTLHIENSTNYSVQVLSEQRGGFRVMLADCGLHHDRPIIARTDESDSLLTTSSIPPSPYLGIYIHFLSRACNHHMCPHSAMLPMYRLRATENGKPGAQKAGDRRPGGRSMPLEGAGYRGSYPAFTSRLDCLSCTYQAEDSLSFDVLSWIVTLKTYGNISLALMDKTSAS
ncbi:hypothetical protein C8Q80DRAFT_1124105 [Daedaleopsis nitida]|nr:hypothetical protein C8Q80DRAFT_1124105 [Daedaleopsis nitida]